jgi:hypothetical protein
VCEEARNMRLRFHDALTTLFFDEPLREFTMNYGVF